MIEILLVAILTLPNTNNVAYEVAGTYTSYTACNAAKRQAEQVPQSIKTGYVCLPADKS